MHSPLLAAARHKGSPLSLPNNRAISNKNKKGHQIPSPLREIQTFVAFFLPVMSLPPLNGGTSDIDRLYFELSTIGGFCRRGCGVVS
jgi:hypothetical protein